MRTRLAVLVFSVAVSLTTLIGATSCRADAVSDWFEFAGAVDDAATKSDNPFNIKTRPAGSQVALAMFEAADSVDRRYRSWLGLPVAAPGASEDLAVATAAHDVLLGLYPAQKPMIEERYALAMVNGEAIGSRARDGGIAAGRAAAAAVAARGMIDPLLHPALYFPAALPGAWIATTSTSIDPAFLTLRPWFLKSVEQFRPGPPIALTDARWVRDVKETASMGGKTSHERSPADTVRAQFWAFYDLALALRAIAGQPDRSLVRNARFYALTEMTTLDLAIATADAKLHYGFWRPIQAIRAGGGNPAITADPMWEPLLPTPLHPEYPCGHCLRAATVAALMEAEGSAPTTGLPFTNPKMPGVVLTIASPAEYARQVSFSRICGGVHFRSTAEASERVGRQIAAYALARFAPAIR